MSSLPGQLDSYVTMPGFLLLNQACVFVAQAFDATPYLVGSSLESRAYHDVDVRVMVPDEQYDRLFPGWRPEQGNIDGRVNAMWSLVCSGVGLYLAQASGLPVDFQVQRADDANKLHSGRRIPLGIYPEPPDALA